MATSATQDPKTSSGIPSANDLNALYDMPSYTGADAGDNQAQQRAELQSQQAKARHMQRLQSSIQGANPAQRLSTGVPQLNEAGQYESPQQQKQRLQELRSESRGRGRNSGEGGEDDDTEDSAAKERAKRAADYPHKIRVGHFLMFAPFAIAQDLLPMAGDVIGIGPFINYPMLPLTWTMYWYLIIRNSPKSIRRKFWNRSAMFSGIGLVPYAGEVTPEWIATLGMSAAMIRNYERGRTGFGESAVKKVPKPKVPKK